MSCTPRFLSSVPETVQRVLPVIRTYANTIVETGELGTGHTIKLLNNFLALATSAVVGEALSTALRLGLDMRILKEVVDSAGGNSVMFQRFMRWTLDGDDSDFKAMMSIAVKDLQYYRRIAQPNGGITNLADAATQVYQIANHLAMNVNSCPCYLPFWLISLMGRTDLCPIAEPQTLCEFEYAMSSPNRNLLIAITLAKIDLPCSLGTKASRLWTPPTRPDWADIELDSAPTAATYTSSITKFN